MSQKKKSSIQLFGTAPSIQQLVGVAVQAFQRGDFNRAYQFARQALSQQSDQPDALYLLGMLHLRTKDYTTGADFIRRALAKHPHNPAGWNNLGIALRATGHVQDAVQAYKQALKLKPDYPDALNNLGNLHQSQGEHETALEHFNRALQLQPHAPTILGNRSVSLAALGQATEALQDLHAALKVVPSNALMLARLAEVQLASGAAAEAERNADAALNIDSKSISALLVKAALAGTAGQWAPALALFERVLNLVPDEPRALVGRGQVLLKLNRFEEALSCCQSALLLAPRNAELHHALAQAYQNLKRYGEAIEALETLLRLEPDYPFALGELLHVKMLACEWSDLDALYNEVTTGIATGKAVAEPFGYQALAESETSLQRCAIIYAEHEYPECNALGSPPSRGSEQRITVGYVCGEFRAQATTILMAGVYEHHDKDRFRIVGFDAGTPDQSTYRARLESAFEKIVPIKGLSDLEAVQTIRAEKVDILVNLNGYFGEERTGIFALRAAPIQVNYLGFPGTLGARYMDYLIADAIVIPGTSRDFYSERVIYLPNCYQANDRQRAIAQEIPTRADMGLPVDAFVFASFNNCYKITPRMFECWIRILKRVPKSVLWLLEDNPETTSNLRAYAQNHGVIGARLITATRMPPAEHLARHSLADLFLDTSPYNAHTTGSDALWAGLPLLTVRGTTFPGRVGASLLLACGLGALVADDLEHYENTAVRLAISGDELCALREQLAQQRNSSLLFNTAQFTADLEFAYATMIESAARNTPSAQ